MEKVLVGALLVLVVAFGVVYFASSQKILDAFLDQGVSLVSDEAEFASRVDQSLGFTASQDASHVLEEPKIEWELEDALQKAEFKYKVFLTGENKVADVRTKFYKASYKSLFGVAAYYKEQENWHSLLEATSLESTIVDEYVLAFDLVGIIGNKVTKADIQKMNDFAKKIAKQLNMQIERTDYVEDALKNADLVYDILDKYFEIAYLELQADWNKSYTGNDIHDAAMGLGLTLTSEEHYAWYSTQTTNQDYFFMMFSGDDGKDFVPEKMAKSSFRIKNIDFGFAVPLVFSPAEAYDNMVNAVKYYQERFGGKIVDRDGNAMTDADFAKEREAIAKLADQLREIGIEPGSFRAYSVFN